MSVARKVVVIHCLVWMLLATKYIAKNKDCKDVQIQRPKDIAGKLVRFVVLKQDALDYHVEIHQRLRTFVKSKEC